MVGTMALTTSVKAACASICVVLLVINVSLPGLYAEGIEPLTQHQKDLRLFQEVKEGDKGVFLVLPKQAIYQGEPQSMWLEEFLVNVWQWDYQVTSTAFLSETPSNRRRLADASDVATASDQTAISGGVQKGKRRLDAQVKEEFPTLPSSTLLGESEPTVEGGGLSETQAAGEGMLTIVMSERTLHLLYPINFDTNVQFDYNETFVQESRKQGHYVTRMESTTTFTGNDTLWLTALADTQAVKNQTIKFEGEKFPTDFVLGEWPPGGRKWLSNIAFNDEDGVWSVIMNEYDKVVRQPVGQSVLFYNGSWNNEADAKRLEDAFQQGFQVDQVIFTERFFPVVFMSLYEASPDGKLEQELLLTKKKLDKEAVRKRAKEGWLITDITQSVKDGTLVVWSRNDTDLPNPTTSPPGSTSPTTTIRPGPVTRPPPRPGLRS